MRKALFNDPERFPGCPEGHCISELIPDSTIRLQYIKDVHAFRAGWQDGNCGYLDNLHTIRKLSVQLGTFGFLWKGARPDLRAVDFMTQQMLKTYPKLEIGLICGLAVGLVPGSILLYRVLEGLMWICTGLFAAFVVTSDGAKKYAEKVRNAWWKRATRSSNPDGSDGVDEYDDQYPLVHLSRASQPTTPPPAYVSVEVPKNSRKA